MEKERPHDETLDLKLSSPLLHHLRERLLANLESRRGLETLMQDAERWSASSIDEQEGKRLLII